MKKIYSKTIKLISWIIIIIITKLKNAKNLYNIAYSFIMRKKKNISGIERYWERERNGYKEKSKILLS